MDMVLQDTRPFVESIWGQICIGAAGVSEEENTDVAKPEVEVLLVQKAMSALSSDWTIFAMAHYRSATPPSSW